MQRSGAFILPTERGCQTCIRTLGDELSGAVNPGALAGTKADRGFLPSPPRIDLSDKFCYRTASVSRRALSKEKAQPRARGN